MKKALSITAFVFVLSMTICASCGWLVAMNVWFAPNTPYAFYDVLFIVIMVTYPIGVACFIANCVLSAIKGRKRND